MIGAWHQAGAWEKLTAAASGSVALEEKGLADKDGQVWDCNRKSLRVNVLLVRHVLAVL